MIKKNFTKIDFVKKIHHKKGFSINLSKKLVDDLIEIFLLNIKKNELVIKNIGSFKLIFKKQRIGRNPKTKENFIIKERNSLSFIPSKNLIDYLNKNYE